MLYEFASPINVVPANFAVLTDLYSCGHLPKWQSLGWHWPAHFCDQDLAYRNGPSQNLGMELPGMEEGTSTYLVVFCSAARGFCKVKVAASHSLKLQMSLV